MTTPLFPSVIAWNVLDGGTDAQDGNNYPGPALQDYAAAVVGAGGAVRARYAGAPGTKTAIGSSDPADFEETTVGTIAIPAGTLSAPGLLRISNFWEYTSGAASTKNMITRINGVSVNAPSTSTSGNQCSLFEHHIEIITATSELVFPSTQIGTNSTSAPTSLNLDIEDEWVITFSARWSDTATDPTAGNVITLLGARVTY
jgi:hypothetical protein